MSRLLHRTARKQMRIAALRWRRAAHPDSKRSLLGQAVGWRNLSHCPGILRAAQGGL